MTPRRPAQPNVEHRPLWTVREVATFLQISEDRAGLMARRGEIPSHKIGHARRYRPAEIERYVDRQTA